MKNNNLKFLTVVFLLLFTGEMFSQFVISGELRPRLEYRDGYKKLNSNTDKPALFVSQRTRLNLGFKNDRFKTYLSLQDVRVWGSQKQLVMNEDFGMSVHEAWAEAFFGKSSTMSAKFGRQEIILDDHRIFGSVGWVQQARSHDAAIFKYTNPDVVDVQFGVAYNNEKFDLVAIPYTKGYKSFQYLWLNKKLMDKKLAISLLFLNKGDEVTNGVDKVWNNYVLTAGTHTKYKAGNLTAALNFYYQMGTKAEYLGNDMNNDPIKPGKTNAMLFGFDVAYKINKLTVGLGYEYQSGNSQTDTSVAYQKDNHAFQPFFGTNHKFNGHMDYFYVGNHKGSVGLQDINLKIKYKADKFYVGGHFHGFMAAAPIFDVDQDVTNPIDPTKAMGSFLGTEMDLFLGFAITKGVNFKIGHSTMFGTRSMEVLKGGEMKQFNNWAYAQVVIKPKFFDSSKFELKKVK